MVCWSAQSPGFKLRAFSPKPTGQCPISLLAYVEILLPQALWWPQSCTWPPLSAVSSTQPLGLVGAGGLSSPPPHSILPSPILTPIHDPTSMSNSNVSPRFRASLLTGFPAPSAASLSSFMTFLFLEASPWLGLQWWTFTQSPRGPRRDYKGTRLEKER